MKKRLITSALRMSIIFPTRNLIKSFQRMFLLDSAHAGYETLYVCGTMNTAPPRNQGARRRPDARELCDHYNAIHRDIYQWFNIQFDHFGRTAHPATEIVQDIFAKWNRPVTSPNTIEQLYSEKARCSWRPLCPGTCRIAVIWKRAATSASIAASFWSLRFD